MSAGSGAVMLTIEVVQKTCVPPVYLHAAEFYAADSPMATQQGLTEQDLRAVRICDLEGAPEPVDVVSCETRPVMCDPCVRLLMLILLDLPFVFDDMDFGEREGVQGCSFARRCIETSLRVLSPALDGELDGLDGRAAAEAVLNSLPWLANQDDIKMHEWAFRLSDAAAEARHLVFRESEERGWLADPDYPEASQW